MSFSTLQYHKRNSQSNGFNSNRRYVLQSPSPSIHTTTITNSNHHQKQMKRENSFQTNFNPRSRNDHIDDPWVKELLQRDIDFSKLDEKEEELQLLHIPYIKQFKSNPERSSNDQHFQTTIKDPDQSPFINKGQSDQYPLRSNSQVNQSSRKWILQQPTNSRSSANHFPRNREKINSRQFHLLKSQNEEQLITEERTNSINSKTNSNNSKQSQYHNQ